MNSTSIPIHVEVSGAGFPCLLLHGGPGMDSSYFFPYLNPLGEFFQMHAIDLRGCGKAPRLSKSEYSAEAMLNDIAAYQTQQGLEKVVLLGHSFGGMLAQKYALKYPEKVSHLILIATASDNSFVRLIPKVVKNFVEIAAAEIKYLRSKRTDEDFKQLVLASIPLYFTPPFYAEAEKVLNKIQYGAGCYEALWSKFLGEFFLRRDLHKILSPSLIISGEHDYIIPPQFSEAAKEKLPFAQHIMLKNVGHFPFIEATVEHNTVIKNWWQSLEKI